MASGARPSRSNSDSADDVPEASGDCATNVAVVTASESTRNEIGRKRIDHVQ